MYKKLISLTLAMFCATCLAGPHRTEQEAVAMAERAAAFARSAGIDQLIDRVNARDEAFFDGEVYVIVLQADGAHVAHPVDIRLLGKAMLDVPDVDGRMFRKERVAIAAAQGKGWIEYRYRNPANGKVQPKRAYVLKVGDHIVSVGIYKH